jgi:hypothetical protein
MEKKWLKINGKYIPVEKKLTYFRICHSSPDIFYDLEGNRYHGYKDPTGSLLGYKTMFGK